MIRADAAATLHRWREVIAATALGLSGLYLASRGGIVLVPLGLAIAALAAALALQAARRLRFAGETPAPGLIEVDEAQITYLTSIGGGAVSLAELAEIRLVTRAGHRYWHLRQTDGTALPIPVDAAGSDALFDAFSTLPGLDTGALVAALGPATAPTGNLPAPDGLSRIIWQRAGKGLARQTPRPPETDR